MSDTLGTALLHLARSAIAQRFGGPAPVVPALPELQHPGATFVTLTQNDLLRGCIGSLVAYRPLAEHLNDLYGKYVMQRQRETHAKALGHASTTDGGKTASAPPQVELF